MRKTKGNMRKLVEYLEKTPIVESACLKLDISRSTYYRWLESDPEFKKQIEKALDQGRSVVNDVAESHLVSNVKNGNMGAIKFWLGNNNERYKKSVQIIKQEMSPVSEEIIDKFMEFVFTKRYDEEK